MRFLKNNNKKKGSIRAGLIISTVLCLVLCACDANVNSSDSSNSDYNSNAGSSSDDVTTSDSLDGQLNTDGENLTSLEVARLMGNGINLGNTMEAYNRSLLGISADISDYETCWGQPVTTKEMIDGMKSAGFDTIRIPVAWVQTMDFENGDYTIREDLLDRVEEITSYALDNDMYVIINDHWDGGWWASFSSGDEEVREEAMDIYTSMWTQIAERFRDYSDHVIFESANEELGYRLNDSYPDEQELFEDTGYLSNDECFEVVNRINQAFVETIRDGGGNNESRFLLIAGFGTDITNTCDDRFSMPKDTATDKLLISVHYYDPSGYCIFDSVSKWGTKDDYQDMNDMLAKMTRFTEQGIGVVIGEYGVVQASSEGGLKEGTVNYTTNLLDNCNKYQYVPVLWDTNFVYDRSACRIKFDDLMRLYQKYSYAQEKELTQDEIADKAEASMAKAYEAAEDGFTLEDTKAVAWIMFTSSDWSVQYSVGDVYDPTTSTEGIVSSDLTITESGTYTVSLDFTGTGAGSAQGITFCALGLANGEALFPECILDIKEVEINGEALSLNGTPYTTSDDSICTRVNLYNGWVTQLPEDVRTVSGNEDATPTPIDVTEIGVIENISVTFELIEK